MAERKNIPGRGKEMQLPQSHASVRLSDTDIADREASVRHINGTSNRNRLEAVINPPE